MNNYDGIVRAGSLHSLHRIQPLPSTGNSVARGSTIRRDPSPIERPLKNAYGRPATPYLAMIRESGMQSMQQITIPSFDGIQLQARLYPAERAFVAEGTGSAPLTVAVIAHPYGSLGGSMNDHVVQTLKATICNEGIPTLIYNSRGVGKSTGRASWTGEPERKDYQTVVEWMVEHGESLWTGRAEEERIGKITVLCCGYSFGALMAGQAVPPSLNPELKVDIRYILLSPPISSVVGFLLTPFRTSQYTRAIQRIISEASSAREDHGAGKKGKVLFVHGGRDNFTDVETYRSWTQRLKEGQQEPKGDVLSVEEVQEADHFWRDSRHREELCEAVSNWL